MKYVVAAVLFTSLGFQAAKVEQWVITKASGLEIVNKTGNDIHLDLGPENCTINLDAGDKLTLRALTE